MILIATKDNETFLIESQKLQKSGYKTICAESHERSLEILRDNWEINLIIIDIDTTDDTVEMANDIISKTGLPLMYITSYEDNMNSEGYYNDFSYGFVLKDSKDFILQSYVKTALNLFEASKKLKQEYDYINQAEMISGFGYWELDINNNTVKSSNGSKKIYGSTGENLSINEIKEYPLPEYREMLDKALMDLIAGRDSYNVEFKIKNKTDGKIKSVHSVAEYDPNRNLVMGTLYDISKQKSAEEAALEKEEEYRKIFHDHKAVMLMIDLETGEIVDANNSAAEFYGWTREEFIKMKITDINTLSKTEVYNEMERARINNKNYFNFKHRLADGSIRDVEVYSGEIISGSRPRLFSIIHDITKRKEAEEKIKNLAFYDSLTTLPNRRMFSEFLGKAIIQGEKEKFKVALLNIDLDHFKNVNDSFGHHIGDVLLTRVAERLRKNLRKNNIICRLGGDEFAVILEGFSDRKEINYVSNRILKVLKLPFIIDGREIFISASIGVAVYPEDGFDVNTLLKNSDLAMYGAKNRGKNGHYFFSEEMNHATNSKMEIDTQLRNALKNGELQLYYQPKIDVFENKIIGTESLLRWFKDGKIYKAPSEFIPIAETTGFILEIDRWVLLTACRQIVEWEKNDIKDQKISVNISGLHFKQGLIVKTVSEVLKKVTVPSGSIEIEITEGVFMGNMKEAVDILNELRSMGIDISIDDFGTGYSSLSYLKNLPINRIKIDRSFILNMMDNKKDIAIAKTVITMAKLLDLYVIAEGVETAEQLKLLSENGCTEIQGFYFSKPMPVEEYEEFLKRWN
jgi:diguanylate cyclase (GGDEF)-like protein/PAS domain S-box-containing protein